jgi:aminoglycoside phosphotransferase (APT) family kinase protein
MTPEALQHVLEPHFPNARVHNLHMLAGGASKEAWSFDFETNDAKLELILRRAGGGAMNLEQLTLAQEFRVIEAAFKAGVTVPEPLAYLPDAFGREAFVSRRVRGEAVGRRVVSKPELEAARATLPKRMAEELAKIHGIPVLSFEFLPGNSHQSGAQHCLDRLYAELDSVNEPHPAIELALAWLRDHEPSSHGHVLLHGDFRIGNLMLEPSGLSAVLDWEFAHIGDPAEDLAWTLIRAWRFGQDQKRLGGIGDVTPYLDHYNALTGRNISLETLFYWEVMGNAKWAVGALTQAKRHLDGHERNVELAVLGRLSGEMELELLALIK